MDGDVATEMELDYERNGRLMTTVDSVRSTTSQLHAQIKKKVKSHLDHCRRRFKSNN